MEKKEIVKYLLSKGYLVNPDSLDNFDLGRVSAEYSLKPNEIDDFKRMMCATPIVRITPVCASVVAVPPIEKKDSSVKIDFSFADESKKRSCDDFVSYFRARFKTLRSILEQRQELQNVISLQRLNSKKEKEQVAIIGMVYEIQKTKSGNIMLTLEDLTGSIKCIIPKENNDMLELAKELVLDEIIGIVGFFNQKFVYANSLIWPDVPLSKELKKSPDEAYAVFLSDTEFGSKYFLKDKFDAFLKWINGEFGSEEQKQIAAKVRYLFVVGDLVEGVGIYPGQEAELLEIDIYKQYEMFAEAMKKIPSRINIVLSPGNHDAMRIAEPQPPLYKDLAPGIWQLPNVTMVSNPAIVNIHGSESFPGFDILLYHGYSFVYYSEHVETIRTAGGQDRVDLIMKLLLKKRHLAPTHTSTLYLPIALKDNLVISKVPDFFVSGHVHQFCAATDKNITLLNCSCWISQTPFQEKMGIVPKPARALVANLQTREIKVMRF